MKQEIENMNKNFIRCAMMQKHTSKRKLPTLLHWLNQGPQQILQRDHSDRNTAPETVKTLLKKTGHRYGTAAEIV